MSSLPIPAVMGILNTTPNSFYDGGKYDVLDAAKKRAEEMIQQGANSIDIGGQSTLEVDAVSAEEECARVIPIIKVLKSAKSDIVISVDTFKAAVAEEALKAGADMINDVSAGRMDPRMFGVIAKAKCPYVMMFCKDAVVPTKIYDVQYDDILGTIHAFFLERLAQAKKAGIDHTTIIIDPGLGHFISSDPQYSWEILEKLEELRQFDCPILVSPSRKSFTAEFPEQPPHERLPGTLKATALALKNGASIIRTHDVEETRNLIPQPPVPPLRTLTIT